MGMITKNGHIYIGNSKKGGKQKGFVTKNGHISILIPHLPTVVVVEEEEAEGYGNAVMGVASGNISTVMGVATANVSKVNGV